MSTTIGGSQERRRRKLGVGCSVDLAVKVIRKAESWLCPCKRMKLKTAERRVLLFGSLFWTLRLQNGDKHVSLGNRQMLLGVGKPGGKTIGRQIFHLLQGVDRLPPLCFFSAPRAPCLLISGPWWGRFLALVPIFWLSRCSPWLTQP